MRMTLRGSLQHRPHTKTYVSSALLSPYHSVASVLCIGRPRRCQVETGSCALMTDGGASSDWSMISRKRCCELFVEYKAAARATWKMPMLAATEAEAREGRASP